jgi:hypothetical protein
MKCCMEPRNWAHSSERPKQRTLVMIFGTQNIKMDLKDWIRLAQDRDECRALANVVMNLKKEYFSTS